MRNPQNNPTERIGRLMEEMDELIYCLDQWMTWSQKSSSERFFEPGPTSIEELPAKPRLPAYEAEKVRRSLTKSRTIYGDRLRKEKNALIGGSLKKAREIDEAEVAAILKEMDVK